MPKTRLIVGIDTETGGFTAKHHSLLTLGMVAGVLDLQARTFERLPERFYLKIKHDQYETTPKALEVNGIDLTSHHRDPGSLYPREAGIALRNEILMHQICTGLDDADTVMLAHNAPFDWGFVQHWLPTAARSIGGGLLCTKSLAKSLRSARAITATSDSLAVLANTYGREQAYPHNALTDIELTMDIFEHHLLAATARAGIAVNQTIQAHRALVAR